MSAHFQTFAALLLVALATVYLVWRFFLRRKPPGCGSSGCGAISPELKNLKSRLKS